MCQLRDYEPEAPWSTVCPPLPFPWEVKCMNCSFSINVNKGFLKKLKPQLIKNTCRNCSPEASTKRNAQYFSSLSRITGLALWSLFLVNKESSNFVAFNWFDSACCSMGTQLKYLVTSIWPHCWIFLWELEYGFWGWRKLVHIQVLSFCGIWSYLRKKLYEKV